MDSECKCQYPNYNAFTGRCMTCGGFHKKDLNMSFDYKSRDWEESNSKPICVACLNESRAHQIPGNYEHICGKQMDNTQQLPAEVSRTIEQQAHDATCALFSPNNYNEFTSYQSGYIKGATEYATKLLQVEQERDQAKKDFEHVQKSAIQYANRKDQIDKERNKAKAMYDTARTLLQKFISRHEAGLLPDRFIYNEIKQFLDGK